MGRAKKETRSAGNKGKFKGGFSEGKPFELSAADRKFFGTTKKTKRKLQIERLIRGKKKGSALELFERKSSE